jgi:hypothetical protein
MARTQFRNDEIPGLIAEMRSFMSVGKLPDGTRLWSGIQGPAVTMGHLPRRFHASARSALYVVYSYTTPVAWVTENEGGPRNRPYLYHCPDVGYSPTTGRHQMACMEAWADHFRHQGNYRRWPGSHREVVRVPGNAEVYGREIRARSGGVDGIRLGGIDDERMSSPSAYEGVSGDAMHWDGEAPRRAHP